MIKKRIIILVFLFISALGDSAIAEEVVDILSKMQGMYDETTDFQAGFTQQMFYKAMDITNETQGTIYFKKPNLMRWDYTKPSKQQIFVSGKDMTLYLPDRKQVIKKDLSPQLPSDRPFSILTDVRGIEKDFEIKVLEEKNDKHHVLELKPRDTKLGLSGIRLDVDKRDYFIKVIQLLEINGNSTTISFSKVKINKGLKEDFFSFSIPEGVEVLEAPNLSTR